jgi:cytoskeletal protein RodZ
MPSTPFGEHLKREREMRGVSLEEVSAATRINTRFLEAIENEKWEELPGGAFNRGFIRAIARFLGLDEDGLVAEYALETKGALDVRPATQHSGDIPRNWQPAAVGAIVVVLVVLLGWFVFHRYGARIAARFHRHSTEVPHTELGILLAGGGPKGEGQIVPGGSH